MLPLETTRCFQKPCVNPCFVLLLTVKGKEDTFNMVLMTACSQLRKRDTPDSRPLIPFQKKELLRQKGIEENSFKNCDKDAKV